MKDLVNIIIDEIDIESNIKNLSVIDEIKIEINYEKFNKILLNYEPKNEIENYIKTFFSKKENINKQLLQINYFNNLFVSINFIIGNYYTIDSDIFEILYDNYLLINKISDIIIDKYEKIIKNKKLYLFYNYELINRWKKTILYKPLNKEMYLKISNLSVKEKEIKWQKYLIIWTEFNNSCIIFKEYIKKLLKFYKPIKNTIVGCYNISKKYYEYCLEGHLGIKLNIKKLLTWAHSELELLILKMKEYIKLIYPNININVPYIKLLKKIKNDPSQKFKSEKELENYFKKVINKYENFYININKFSNFDKPNLVIFSNSKMGGGYYTSNNFYLNTYYWKDKRKYTVESLVLHETVPGHHTQVSTMLNLKNDFPILFYFSSILNGFIEGWGLWAEKLGINQTTWDKIGGVEYEILRTLRIIVDINIHYYGKTPKTILLFMKQYLTLSDNEILNEIYRYVCQPGQAVSYKVGCQVFKKIIENKNINDIINNKSLDIYKNIISDGPLPLKFLIEKYNIDLNTLFI